MITGRQEECLGKPTEDDLRKTPLDDPHTAHPQRHAGARRQPGPRRECQPRGPDSNLAGQAARR